MRRSFLLHFALIGRGVMPAQGSPNTTFTVLSEVAKVGLCKQLWVDTHVTPSTTLEGARGVTELAAQLQTMAASVRTLTLPQRRGEG